MAGRKRRGKGAGRKRPPPRAVVSLGLHILPDGSPALECREPDGVRFYHRDPATGRETELHIEDPPEPLPDPRL